MTVLAPPLDAVSRRARPYPADALPEGGTALALFAAAYQGHNDAIHFARKDMTATCVDINGPSLAKMSELYPSSWEFFVYDAWAFAEDAAERGRFWDVVSVDTYTGDATDRSLETLPLWCAIADVLVTATIPTGRGWAKPHGWHGSLFPRSALASWLVLRRD